MRLTKKSDNLYYTNAKFSSGSVFLDNNGSYTNACVTKLGQLEDIEEELGIDLLTLFKAFSKGSVGSVCKFVQNDYNEEYEKGLVKPLIINYFFRKPSTSDYQLSLYDSLTCKNYIVDTKDYGKTWALTKEELL